MTLDDVELKLSVIDVDLEASKIVNTRPLKNVPRNCPGGMQAAGRILFLVAVSFSPFVFVLDPSSKDSDRF